MVQRRGWLVLLLAVLLKILLLLCATDPAINQKMERYKQSYTATLCPVEGELTDEHDQWIMLQKEQLQAANQAYQAALNQLTDGTITEMEFLEISRESKAMLSQEPVYQVLFTQYDYVREQPETRYLLYTNGWMSLLGTEKLDLLLLLVITLLVTTVFRQEYTSEMMPIFRSCRMGRSHLFYSKVLACLLIAAALTTAFYGTELLFCACHYGLPHGEYPIQSLTTFQSSGYAMSLAQLAVTVFLEKLLAGAYLSAILIFGIVAFKRPIATVFLAFCVTILPYFLFGCGVIRYLLPTPLGWLLSIGFWQATVKNSANEEVFLPLSGEQSAWVLTGTLLILLFFIQFARQKFVKPE